MSAGKSVQGVQGCVGFIFCSLHIFECSISGLPQVCAGCAGLTRARAYTRAFSPLGLIGIGKNLYASLFRPYTPCTLYTQVDKCLIYIYF